MVTPYIPYPVVTPSICTWFSLWPVLVPRGVSSTSPSELKLKADISGAVARGDLAPRNWFFTPVP